ncbi:hypothetical protein PJL15_03795 [Paenarthrobacter nitroguajacolicus]|nr:hypothetical protein [Paenarthrobacter nitroguajacolicus]
MTQDGGVKIGAAKCFYAVRTAQEFESPGSRFAQHRGIKGAATEVVHGNGAAVLHPGLGGIVQGSGHWFADQGDVLQPGHVQRGQDRGCSVSAPSGGMGHDDRRRRTPLALFGPVHDPSGHGCVDVLRRQPAPAHGKRNGVTNAAFELPDHPAGIIQAPALSGLPHQYPAVICVEKHRGHSTSVEPQRKDFRRGCGAPGRLDQSCGCVTCPDIDGENIAHGYLESSHGMTQASGFTGGS